MFRYKVIFIRKNLSNITCFFYFWPIFALGHYETTFHEHNNKDDYVQRFIRLVFILLYVRMTKRIQSVIIKSFPFNFKITFNAEKDSYCKYSKWIFAQMYLTLIGTHYKLYHGSNGLYAYHTHTYLYTHSFIDTHIRTNIQ